MRLLEFLQRHLVASSALFGACAGIVVGLFLPIRASTPAPGEELVWSLPAAASVRRFDPEAYESLKTARFWGAEAPVRGGPRAAGWTLRAIMTRPGPRAAIMADGNTAPVWVPVGGLLPDGATLVALDRDTVWFEKDGCRRAKRLYPSRGTEAGRAAGTPAPGDEECIGQAPNVAVPDFPGPATDGPRGNPGSSQSNGS